MLPGDKRRGLARDQASEAKLPGRNPSRTPTAAYFINRQPLGLQHFRGRDWFCALGPAFDIAHDAAEAAAARRGVRVWPYYIRAKNPFVLPSNALPVRLDSGDKRHFREALLGNGHDAICLEWRGKFLVIPLTPDIIFLDQKGTMPAFGSAPSVQRLNDSTVLIRPAKRRKVRRAKRAHLPLEV